MFAWERGRLARIFLFLRPGRPRSDFIPRLSAYAKATADRM
jgi:hypothetical protein